MEPTRKKIVNPGHQAALTIEKQFSYQFRRRLWMQLDQPWGQVTSQVNQVLDRLFDPRPEFGIGSRTMGDTRD